MLLMCSLLSMTVPAFRSFLTVVVSPTPSVNWRIRAAALVTSSWSFTAIGIPCIGPR
jgi:hypothetical protein